MNIFVEKAINTPSPLFSSNDYLRGSTELNSTAALLYLIIYDYEQEDSYEDHEEVQSAIYTKLSNVISGCKEPAFDNSHCWGYSPLCASIALIKNKESLWDLFNIEEQARLTQCMKMFLYMWNWGCNKHNNFRTGAGLHGNFTKANSVNYMLTNNVLITFCRHFFGDLSNTSATPHINCNNILTTADYDAEIAKLREFNFMNAYTTWTRPEQPITDEITQWSTRDLFIDGKNRTKLFIPNIQFEVVNPAYAGYGRGVKINISYWNPTKPEVPLINVPIGLINDILDYCFNQRVISSVIIEDFNFTAKCKNDAVSPYENQEGMMEEFNLNFDGAGRRSSLFHCDIDFVLVSCLMAAWKHLGIYDIMSTDRASKIAVGMNDYLFKKMNNYEGFSLGYPEKPGNSIDISIWKHYWETVQNPEKLS